MQAPQLPPISGSGTFALPAKPAPRNSGAPARRRSTALPVSHPLAWTGEVFQELHGRRMVYLSPLSIDLPFEHAAELGATLEVTQIAPRKGIKLGQHYVCRCTLPELSRSQTSKLKALAQHELVMVAPLHDNGLILVPYTDSAGGLKLVAFFVLVPSS